MCSLDILIAGKYRLGRKLGGGSFGEIFLGTNLQTGEEVGIKLVSLGTLEQLLFICASSRCAPLHWRMPQQPGTPPTHTAVCATCGLAVLSCSGCC
jgi:hypothetical protein